MLTFKETSARIYLEIFLNSTNEGMWGDLGFPETLKALSDPVRREILELLKNQRLSAGDIARQFHLSGATVSYHLSQLKKAGLIFETKHKNYIYYEIQASVFEELILWISQFGGEKNEKK